MTKSLPLDDCLCLLCATQCIIKTDQQRGCLSPGNALSLPGDGLHQMKEKSAPCGAAQWESALQTPRENEVQAEVLLYTVAILQIGSPRFDGPWVLPRDQHYTPPYPKLHKRSYI